MCWGLPNRLSPGDPKILGRVGNVMGTTPGKVSYILGKYCHHYRLYI